MGTHAKAFRAFKGWLLEAPPPELRPILCAGRIPFGKAGLCPFSRQRADLMRAGHPEKAVAGCGLASRPGLSRRTIRRQAGIKDARQNTTPRGLLCPGYGAGGWCLDKAVLYACNGAWPAPKASGMLPETHLSGGRGKPSFRVPGAFLIPGLYPAFY